MSTTMYEILYIIDSSLEESQIEKISNEVKAVITDDGGEILKEVNWGKRTLAFPVKKKTEGLYINMDFNGPADMPLKINEYETTHAGLLRHMTLKVSKARLEQDKYDEAKKQKEKDAIRKAREEELAAVKASEEAAAAKSAAEAAAKEAAENTPQENAPESTEQSKPAESAVSETPAAFDESKTEESAAAEAPASE